MFVELLDIPSGKISERAQRLIDRAASEAQRRGHEQLRGMFEERLQNIVREVKERPNLGGFSHARSQSSRCRQTFAARWSAGSRPSSSIGSR